MLFSTQLGLDSLNFVIIFSFSLLSLGTTALMVLKILNRDTLTKKYDESYNSLKLREIYRVKGDGHCLIYSVINCMLEYRENHYIYNTKEVINGLRNEIKKNWSKYCNFLPSHVNTEIHLQLFEENKRYNLEICDTFLLALCNLFNVEIVVVERARSGMDEIKHVVHPNCPASDSFPQRIFYLYKTFDHYDPLLINGEYSSYMISLSY